MTQSKRKRSKERAYKRGAEEGRERERERGRYDPPGERQVEESVPEKDRWSVSKKSTCWGIKLLLT